MTRVNIAFADEVQVLVTSLVEDVYELGFTREYNAVWNVVNFL